MEADTTGTLASIFRGGTSASAGKVSPSALLTQNGGPFGAAHRAPATSLDIALWPAADFQALNEAFRTTGFRAANSWYLNGTANIAYSHTAPNRGRLSRPVFSSTATGTLTVTSTAAASASRCTTAARIFP